MEKKHAVGAGGKLQKSGRRLWLFSLVAVMRSANAPMCSTRVGGKRWKNGLSLTQTHGAQANPGHGNFHIIIITGHLSCFLIDIASGRMSSVLLTLRNNILMFILSESKLLLLKISSVCK